MTTTGRQIVAVLAMLIGCVLVVIGYMGGHNPDGTVDANAGILVTGGFGLLTAVLGFAFGNQNGEARLARALTVVQAEQIAPGSTDPGATMPAPSPAGAPASSAVPAATGGVSWPPSR